MAGLTPALLGSSAGLGAVGTINSLITGGAQASYKNTIEKINQQFADLQSQDALRRGELEAQQVALRGKQFEGEQIVGYAGQNVDVTKGTPAAVVAQDKQLSKEDELIVRNNALREALGYKFQAFGIGAQRQLERSAARGQQVSTALTGGMQFARGLAQYGAYQEGRA